MRNFAFLWATLLALFAFAPASAAQDALRGVALVVGNGDYGHLPSLPNPPKDADAIETILSDLGFDSVRRSDRDAAQLRRDLERFVEDAEGADVAVFYYAGHGIEAGGENYLVPVDADLSALDSADEALVPVSALIRRLRETVGITIVLLDACRDNPFPAGATLKLASGATAPVSAGGLAVGDTRGAKALSRPDASAGQGRDDSLGIVIGFAAEPGAVALDGAAGDHSPYAAAILRHLGAMSGEEFGTVMRMVAEEVYLKTGGAQRPWMNESMRRLLHFGETIDAPDGVEGDILRERRQLLLTISALPDPERRSVERASADGGVPMDALYGMLRALGTEAPKDPVELERLLRDQSARIEEMRREQAAIRSTDPEIARLSSLADSAMAEGALQTALALHDQAKARVREVETTVEAAEADIVARRKEFADVFAASGRANYTAFNYEQAAADYEQAYLQVERWDGAAAWSHRGNQAIALQDSGWKRGATENLRKAATLAEEVVRLAERLPSRTDWAMSQVFLGNVLLTLGQRANDQTLLERAAAAYEQALTIYSSDDVAAGGVDRIDVLHNLAGAYVQIAALDTGTQSYLDGIARFEELARLVPRSTDALVWARTATSMGSAMNDLARREGNVERFRDSARLLEQALEARATATPDERRDTLEALAVAYSEIGNMDRQLDLLRKGEAMFTEALALIDRQVEPVDLANLIYSRGLNLHQIANLTRDVADYERAAATMREAIAASDATTLDSVSAQARSGLAGALLDMGRERQDVASIEEAMKVFGEALEHIDRSADPEFWADTVSRRADAWRNIADRTADHDAFMAALDLHGEALAVPGLPAQAADDLRQRVGWFATSYDRVADRIAPDLNLAMLRKARALLADDVTPGARAFVDSTIGRALYAKGIEAKDPAVLREAIDAYRASLVDQARDPRWESYRTAQVNLALACIELDRIAPSPAALEEAVAQLDSYLAEETDDEEWRRHQRRLADALTRLADGGNHAMYPRSADAWRDLIERLPASTEPLDRAWALESKASALQNMVAYGTAPTTPEAALREALEAYADARRLYSPKDNFGDWFRVTENRADLLRSTGSQERSEPLLREAVLLYDELAPHMGGASDAQARRRVSLGHANALAALAAQTRDPASHDRAIALFEDTLGRQGERAEPADWMNVVAFANTVSQRGMPTRDRATAARAAALLDSLGNVGDLDPVSHAWLRHSQADAWAMHGFGASDPAYLERAIAAYSDVASVYTEADYPQHGRSVAASLANAQILLGVNKGDTELIRQGLATLTRLSSEVSRKDEALLWGFVANGIVYAQTQLARLGQSADLSAAVALGRDAVALYRAQPGMKTEVAEAEDTLCAAMTELGAAQRDASMLREALSICDKAVATLTARAVESPEAHDNRRRAAERLSGIAGRQP